MSIPVDHEKRPYIYFNSDLSLMMVQHQNDFVADIFKKSNSDQNISNVSGIKDKNSYLVQWKVQYHIHRYPIMLKHKSCTNFLFSPSFERYIDIDFRTAEFVIRASKDERVVARIPSGMISVSFKGKHKSMEAIPALASRICFFSESQIRVMTKEGLDCILDYEQMILVSATAVDNMSVNDFDHPHFYLEKLPRKRDEVIKRLVRMRNNIKL